MELTDLPFEYETRYGDHFREWGIPMERAAMLEERDRQLEDYLAKCGCHDDGEASDPFVLCSTPAGYSEKDYTGRTTEGGGDIYGFHDLNTGSCRIDYNWPRNSTGGPSYARIDVAPAEQISEPEMSFRISGTWKAGQFSWGIASIGLGAPGAASDDAIDGPSMKVDLTADDDIAPSSPDPKFRGVFVNTAGTVFTTAWAVIQPHGQTFTQQELSDAGLRIWIEGGVGYVTDGTTTESVALIGSFLGDWDRWESWHNGGGGAGGNAGGAGEGDQWAAGYISDIAVPTFVAATAVPVAIADEGSLVVSAATKVNFTGSGVTATDAGSGVVDVDIPGDWPTSLDGLTDVDTTTTAPADGDSLVYDGTSSLWVPGRLFASGSDTIADAATTRDVSHGLGVTPETVLLTPRANEAVWVSTRGSLTFTVARAGSTGALDFDWLATGEEVAAATYEDEVLADSPEGYWRLDELSGDVIDLGSLANNLVVTGSPTRGVAGAVSDGAAYTFAGSEYATGAQDTGYGATDGPFGINTHSMVAEMWLKWTATGLMCPFAMRGPNSAEEALLVLVNRTTSGDIVIYRDAGDRARAVGPYNDGNWHHVVARFEAASTEAATATRLFVDGVEVASGSGGWPNVPADGYRPIVAANGTGQTFVGSIDEVAFYPTLSSTRIAAHYAAA